MQKKRSKTKHKQTGNCRLTVPNIWWLSYSERLEKFEWDQSRAKTASLPTWKNWYKPGDKPANWSSRVRARRRTKQPISLATINTLSQEGRCKVVFGVAFIRRGATDAAAHAFEPRASGRRQRRLNFVLNKKNFIKSFTISPERHTLKLQELREIELLLKQFIGPSNRIWLPILEAAFEPLWLFEKEITKRNNGYSQSLGYTWIGSLKPCNYHCFYNSQAFQRRTLKWLWETRICKLNIVVTNSTECNKKSGTFNRSVY